MTTDSPDRAAQARRLVVLGDEMVTGFGDPRALGWVGRLAARAPVLEVLTTALAVAGETTTELAARWEREAALRQGGSGTYLVLAPGAHDLSAGLSMARSRLNLANMLDAATSARIPVLVVGPAPRNDVDPGALRALCEAFADVCVRRGVTYVDPHAALLDHEQWHADLAAGDGVHPGQAGYSLLAWLVEHHGWADWLGVDLT